MHSSDDHFRSDVATIDCSVVGQTGVSVLGRRVSYSGSALALREYRDVLKRWPSNARCSSSGVDTRAVVKEREQDLEWRTSRTRRVQQGGERRKVVRLASSSEEASRRGQLTRLSSRR